MSDTNTTQKVSISSDEINYLIQRYFQEFGYNHSAFSFGAESNSAEFHKRNKLNEKKIPPGSLVYLIQKGVLFAQIEKSADEASADPDNKFSHELNFLRSNLKQSANIIKRISDSTAKTKILKGTDISDMNPVILSPDSSLMLQGHTTPCSAIAWSESSKYLATAACDGTIVIWTFLGEDKKEIMINHASFVPDFQNGEHTDITNLEFMNDNMLIASSIDGRVFVFENGVMTADIRTEVSPLVSMSCHNGMIAIASSKGLINIIKDKSIIKSVNMDDGPVTDLCWFSDSCLVISVGVNVFKIHIDDVEQSIILQAKGNIVQLSVNKDKSILAVADESGHVTYIKNGNLKVDPVFKNSACTLIFSPLGNGYYVGSVDGHIKSGSFVTSDSINFTGHENPPYTLAVDPKEKYLASGSGDGLIYMWETSSGKKISSYISLYGIVKIIWSYDCRFLTIGLANGAVSLINFDFIC